MKIRSLVTYVALGAVAVAGLVPPAAAAPDEKLRDPRIALLEYAPDPAIELIPPLPNPAAVPKANPTGKYNAYDMNVFEAIWFPTRQAGDASAKDEPGGAIAHGTCPPPKCTNHMLEFADFWEKEMMKLVGPWGGATHRYAFEHPGDTGANEYVLSGPPGKSFNLQATIPGAVHPEQVVVVSGHYDMTTSGPASAWDSAEGHATVFRIAKLMTDFWRKTGTRPAVTVKFSAWAAEEVGTHGSNAWVQSEVVPFPNKKVLGYFNLDPCAGAYPAMYRGNPGYQVPMVMHLSDPDKAISPVIKDSINRFNKTARQVKNDVLEHLDDTLTDVPGSPQIFVTDKEAEAAGLPTMSDEDRIVEALGGLLLFTSDYRNFTAIGVPIFNLFPDMFTMHSNLQHLGWQADGFTILHTPRDNLLTLNALTGVDQSGLTPSQGWYKGMEFCAHMHSWFMLQDSMAGAVKRTAEPVAYFEANQALVQVPGTGPAIYPKEPLTFDASASHAFASPPKLSLVPTSKLEFRWDLGDGTKASGPKVVHAYKQGGAYTATLTVTAPGGASDTMTLIVNVI